MVSATSVMLHEQTRYVTGSHPVSGNQGTQALADDRNVDRNHAL